MTALTLPRFAVRYGDGPGYPMGDGVDGATLTAFTPLLPEGFAWRKAATDGAIELDISTVAELLLCSQINTTTASDQDAIAAVHDQLCRCRCDRMELLAAFGAEAGELPETTPLHMARCLVLAARLTGVRP